MESSAFTNGEYYLSAWPQLPGLSPSCWPLGHPPPLQDHVYVPTHRRYLSCTTFVVKVEREPERTTDANVRLHLGMGFIINLKKSSLIPSQVMVHIGALVGTLLGIIRPIPDKVREISLLSQNLLASGSISMRGLQQVVGTFAACHTMFPLCLFRPRPIFTLLSRNFKQGRDNLSKKISLQEPRSRRPYSLGQTRVKSTSSFPVLYRPQSRP